MSTPEKNESAELSQPDTSREKGGKGKPSSSTKSKDLSHVPCKFFKVGSCTAGSSCPFSHTALESGAQKDVCAWFVKGNCKFGHKCALAHILPGQSMAMDKKNKKAAQQAAAAANGGKESNRGGKGTRREGQGGGRNSLFAGSTAPTRMLGSNRSAMPMPLKASLSPSAPAPPLQDTEFAQFGLPAEDNKLETAPAHGKQGSTSEALAPEAQSLSQGNNADEGIETTNTTATSPLREGLPVNSSRRPAISHHARSSNPDFGPIGSPSRSIASGTSVPRVNGFSPGTSPPHNNYPTSPFSAPGTQSVFIDAPPQDQGDRYRSGIAASLGATHSSRVWNTDAGSRPRIARIPGTEEAVEEDELEDFIPGSLTDLLTPEERSRRMSRSNSNQPLGAPVHSPREPSAIPAESTSNAHRYSRSVPAPSLLGDIRSIWSDKGAQSPNTGTGPLPPGSPADPSHMTGLTIGNGTPSSFKSSGFGGKSFTEDQLNNPMLSPSNASAAFLPGLHQHYRSKLDSTSRSTLYPATGNLSPPVRQFQPSTTLTTSHMHTAFGSRLATSGVGAENLLSPARPIPQSSTQAIDTPNRVPSGDLALSPSSRALHAHAPGQSLPQGLAAGYSRIHALPPTNFPSPTGLSSGFGTSPGLNTSWASLTTPPTSTSPAPETKLAPGTTPPGGTTANAALESMFSRLSYSAAAATRNTPSTNATPALSRNVSGGRQWQVATNAQSPLSGPVVTGEDDDLFGMNMDG